MVTISKATILKDVWETIRDRMSSDVTSVTTDASVVFTIQTYTSSFPDSRVDDKSSYPILIVNPVSINWEPHTFTKKHAIGSVTVDIYATNSEATDMFLDAIIDSLETYRTTLAGLGVEFFDLDSTDSDNVIRQAFKVHVRSVTFSFRFAFTKTHP